MIPVLGVFNAGGGQAGFGLYHRRQDVLRTEN